MKFRQYKIAEEIGIADSTLSGLFTGKLEPGKEVAKKIANYIGEEHWGLVFEMSPREMESAIQQAHLSRNRDSDCQGEQRYASASCA